ncbi:hypothetical protein [Rhizobium sp. GN54]|uniref:hypothetical protein n=1 Tax=Rhizobium sp. GN54 TaxID=2898150 RepID=UPI001E3F0DB1|nr:hypothetical protein [Rhizobium sp. GN54]MCD2183333.1 hypothetical protein [Rhizobium sp. GN54]
MLQLSDTPAGSIARLDAALSRRGEDIVISRQVKRSAASVKVEVACRALVRAVSADQIAGTITQNDLNVTLSPTEIAAAGWPGQDDNIVSGSAVDPRVPRTTDKVVIQGRERQVRASKAILMANVWVRTDMIVAG